MTVSHLIVTGGTGYIGARLVRTALAQGRAVTLLGRTPGSASTRFVPWQLGEMLPAGALRSDLAVGEQALVHLAHDWRCANDGSDGNIAGTQRLFADAARAMIGSRIFVSSQSARCDAPNRYGRSKWAIERLLPDAASLRVGLVYGGPPVAMFGLLCRLARCRVLPMVEPRRPVQPIHLDEVVDGILAAVDAHETGVLALAGPSVPFETVLKLLAEKLAGRRLLVLPVDLRLALFGCDVIRRLAPTSRIDRERVLGLVGTRTVDSTDDLARLGVLVKPMAERLVQEPYARRAVLAEARALLHACLGRPASPALLRRYARAAGTGAIALPLLPRRLLRWCEPIDGGASPLSSRLRLAAHLAETSPEGERALAEGSRTGRLLRLAMALAVEALLLPFRLAGRVVLR